MAYSAFTKRPTLNLSEHLVILGVFFGMVYILGSYLPAYLGAVISVVIVAYVLFWFWLLHSDTKGKIYQNAIAHFPTEIRGKDTVITKKPQILATYKKATDFKGYITDRNNRNLFVAGRSGSGKSTLMRYLINLFPDSAKTIFSFKAGDEYLRLGIPILRISDHPGDPFADKEAFVQAFLVTYPMNSQGMMAASIPSLLRKEARQSSSWKELRANIESVMERENPGSVTHSAYSFIHQKLPDLELNSRPYAIDMNKDMILDFSGLNESAKTFYAELYLRQSWHSIEASPPDPMKHIIIIDETHRLLKTEATIFGDVARLIRSKGALWSGTQNYTDLPDYVRNQFTMHLLFSTTSDKDLRALKEVNILLPFVATEIADHHFTDAASRELHDAIPIYTADIQGFKDYPESYITPELPVSAATEEKPKELLDYSEQVLKLLEGGASWPSRLTKRMIKDFNLDETTAKLMVSKALHNLHKEGLVGREHLKMDEKEISLYYRRDSSLSGLHKFMVETLVKKLDERSEAYKLPNGREGEPDISTEKYDIEVETGLKNDIKSFVQRLSGKTKKTYVVVPNDVEKDRYRKAISNPSVMVLRLDEFLIFISR